MIRIRPLARHGIALAMTLAVLGLAADVMAGDCRPGRGYYRTTHYSGGYYHGPYNYYPSRHYRSYRYLPSRVRYNLRYGSGYCDPYTPRRYSSYYPYPRRSLRYSGYASFTVGDPYRCSMCHANPCCCAAAVEIIEPGRAVRSSVPPANVIVITNADREEAKDPAVVAAAWKLLEDGQSDEALLEFTRLATAAPKEALPKVGYSLAAAMINDDYNAQWAMRRALRVDPEGLHDFAASPALAARLRGLVDRYLDQMETSKRPARAQFMLASIHYLLHEYEDARPHIEAALAAGDTQRSTQALRELVVAELSEINDAIVETPAPADDDAVVEMASSQTGG